MRIVQVARTPDGYFLIDATGTSDGAVTFAPSSSASTEDGLRAVLRNFDLTESAIDNALRQVNEIGTVAIELKRL